jgi:hypothetical protein
MTKFLCDDGNCEVEIEADSAQEAAQEYVDGGDWGEDDETFWIDVFVQEVDEDGEEVGDRESVTIQVDPPEPKCVEDQEHEWKSPYSVLGGLKENPGVQGHGGGVIIREVCKHCGKYKTEDTWAQNSNNGQQGLDSVKYEEADESSEEWVNSLANRDV